MTISSFFWMSQFLRTPWSIFPSSLSVLSVLIIILLTRSILMRNIISIWLRNMPFLSTSSLFCTLIRRTIFRFSLRKWLLWRRLPHSVTKSLHDDFVIFWIKSSEHRQWFPSTIPFLILRHLIIAWIFVFSFEFWKFPLFQIMF